MSESSIFHKEEELLEFGARFLEEFGPDVDHSSVCSCGHTVSCGHQSKFYQAFSRVFTSYAKLFQQMTRLIRLSDRQQLRLDLTNQSLKENQQQLERRNRFIRSIFSRYMSDEVVESILETPEGLSMGGEKRLVTVVMSDLRGFTAISDTLPPETVVTIINLYLEVMTEIIFKYHGTINSFLGDGIMILFGAPIGRADDAQRAVACALEMQLAMPGINITNQKLGYPELGMGIGIHSGMVVAGNIGSSKRSHYTVMGRVVNLSARIESYSVSGQVLVSERTRTLCNPLLQVDDSMEVVLKGVEQPVTVHQVSAIRGPYDVHLHAPGKVVYHKLTVALPIRFATLEGKLVQSDGHEGEIVWLTGGSAKIKTATNIARLTNLSITVYHDGIEMTRMLFGKTPHGTVQGDDLVEVIFTFVPAVMHAFFQEILKTGGVPPSRAHTEVSAPPVVKSKKRQEDRHSLRRSATHSVLLPVELEDGETLVTTVGDFSLDGMFLNTGVHKPPKKGIKGSFVVVLHGTVYRFAFEVAHAYQNGIGVRIIKNHENYSMVLLDGAFGALFPSES